jgi:hypothetical protein
LQHETPVCRHGRKGAAPASCPRRAHGPAALAGLAIIFTTDQSAATSSTVPSCGCGSARAAGFGLLLLSFQVVVGLVLSHPTNKSTWRLSKLLFPWHDHAWLFTIAFVVVHVVSIATDRFANVGWLGAVVPGLSEYRRSSGLGTLGLYALLITGLTARLTRLLPSGWWLKLHRLSLGVLALAWAHGMLAGTDTFDAAAIYGATFVSVGLAAAYRYWIVRSGRPPFATSLTQEVHR